MLPTHELLHLLKDETIVEIAARYFDTSLQPNVLPSTAPMANMPDTTRTSVCEKAKRPLNAFMAFRSKCPHTAGNDPFLPCLGYYLKLFPDLQQKTASGFLTTLWNKDPFRNKWALIAKVYSFVRDEVGKDKITLAYFLSFSCPLMGIIEPQAYLTILGWSVQEDSTPQKLIQDQAMAALGQAQLQSGEFPSTEIELLTALINVGYLPEQGVDLMRRLGANSSTIMATTNPRLSLPVSYTPEKLQFMGTIRADPVQATKELLGDAYDEYTIQMLGVKAHNVEDLDAISHLPMQVEMPDPRYYYNYSTSHSQLCLPEASVMRFENIPEHESFDIDSPWDVDAMLGQTQSEGARSKFTYPLPKSTSPS